MMNGKENLHGVVRLISRFSKVFGMAPYSLASDGYRSNLKFGLGGFLNLSLGLLTASVMLVCFVKLIVERADRNFYTKVNVILEVLGALRILSAIVTIPTLFFAQDRLIAAYEKLDGFNEKKSTFEDSTYSKHYKAVLLFICLILLLIIGIEFMYYFVEEEGLEILTLDLLSNRLQFLVHLIVLLYFEMYVLIITANFKFVTSTTKSLIAANDRSLKQTLVIVKTISLMYDDLCKGAELINSVFSFPLFALISLNSLETLLGIYLIQDPASRNIRVMFWTAFYTVQQLCILMPPGNAQDEAKEITKHFSEAELQLNKGISDEKNHFLLRTLHQSISFNACGFFPISMSAIVGQFSISISFLLFMFQIIK